MHKRLHVCESMPLLRQVVGNHVTVALRNTLLGTQQTCGRGHTVQALNEQITSLAEETAVTLSPVIFVRKKGVTELHEGDVPHAGLSKQTPDPFVGGLRLCIRTHAGPIRPQSNVDHGCDVVLLQQRQELFGLSSAVADSLEVHGLSPLKHWSSQGQFVGRRTPMD